MKRILIISVILAAMLLSACGTPAVTKQPAPKPTSGVTDTSAETQAKRYNYIQELIAKGVILKVEKPSTLPHVWVTPAFYTLDFDMKQTFISVIWTYYIVQDSEATTVRLFDGKTGKQIGTFDQYSGLKLD